MKLPGYRTLCVLFTCVVLTSCESSFPGDQRTENAFEANIAFSQEFQDRAKSRGLTNAAAWEQALKGGVSARSTTPLALVVGGSTIATGANIFSIKYAVARSTPAGDYKAAFEILDKSGGVIGTVITDEFAVSGSRTSAAAKNGILYLVIGLVCAAILKEVDDGIGVGIFATGALLGIGGGILHLVGAIFFFD